MVRSVSATKVLALRQQTQILWERYFSSIEKIVFTTLEIIRERLPSQPSRDGLVWNSSPGALLTLPHFSDTLHHYPFYYDMLGSQPDNQFTAVIYSQLGGPAVSTSPLYRLIKNVARSLYIARVSNTAAEQQVPSAVNQQQVGRPASSTSISQRFYPHPLIQTAAVLSLDEDCLLTTDEVDFAFAVWKSFPDRIVGYPARSHYWDDAKGTWGYTSKWTNDYSIVLTGAAFYHRYYNFLYTHWLSPLLHKTVEQSQNCEDILMNFLVSHVTRRPPIKVTQRKQYKEQPPGGARSPWNDPDHFIQRQTCLNTFAAVFGYMPLLRSNMRLDPVLFKDPVSNLRKKYRQIELVGSYWFQFVAEKLAAPGTRTVSLDDAVPIIKEKSLEDTVSIISEKPSSVNDIIAHNKVTRWSTDILVYAGTSGLQPAVFRDRFVTQVNRTKQNQPIAVLHHVRAIISGYETGTRTWLWDLSVF
ncbi:hypothetical protein Cfor_00928 [Coptotermes formosanus]|uniref:Glycosyl transferase 64 domain-containing protein n=1 Tax=Coptotermes formosanus TaxID=36987 RepID=A0A6L2QBE5_COPFO|nr:hypothetical protein Cfor_00928 [Coptotermes formosanus]